MRKEGRRRRRGKVDSQKRKEGNSKRQEEKVGNAGILKSEGVGTTTEENNKEHVVSGTVEGE